MLDLVNFWPPHMYLLPQIELRPYNYKYYMYELCATFKNESIAMLNEYEANILRLRNYKVMDDFNENQSDSSKTKC